MSNTKKIALMSTLVLLLAVTAIFNFVLAGTRSTTVDGASGTVTVNYFTTYRAERTTTRNEEFVQLDSIIAAYAPGTEEHTLALAEKQRMVEIMEDELVMETIIRTMGFSDVAVAIGDSKNINVFINSNELTDEMIVKIFYTFEVEHKIRDGKIIIMPVYAES